MFRLGIVDLSKVNYHTDGSPLHLVVYTGTLDKESKMGTDKYDQRRWYELPIKEKD